MWVVTRWGPVTSGRAWAHAYGCCFASPMAGPFCSGSLAATPSTPPLPLTSSVFTTNLAPTTHQQPHGLSCAENIVKECWEEAGIPQQLAAGAVPVGFVSYVSWSEEGLKPDVLFCYDLQLPADFVPVPQDGEVRDRVGVCVLGWPRGGAGEGRVLLCTAGLSAAVANNLAREPPCPLSF